MSFLPRHPRRTRVGGLRRGGGRGGEVDDAEFEAEQAYIDGAYACLAAMRERVAGLEVPAADQVTREDWERSLARRLSSLSDSGRPLCFGRIDESGGDTWYIGRRHVEDDDADPVVVEWRAPVALPFYRARMSDPMDLVRRRQFVADRNRLLSMADDVFTGEGKDDGPRVRGGDALLAELERARTGEMLDIVATIQVEQDEIIRSAAEGVLTVQGGPGTGKTAVGLHRAAFLLYGNDALARAGVLVVGPSRTFLRYIGHVLPSLGEAAVVQTTPRDLVPDVRVVATEPHEVARLKGDRRMADVLVQALATKRRPLEDDIVIRFSLSRVVLTPSDAAAIVATIGSRRMPYADGRTAVREQLVRLLYDRYSAAVGPSRTADFGAFASAVRGDAGFRASVDRLWPNVTAVGVVREVLTQPARLGDAADGILSADEQTLILRRGRRPDQWTDADVAIIDEAQDLVSGRLRTYGHVVVDEAQDLSPMQWRMLGRRCPVGSMTVLGDIAQGIGVWAIDDWADAVVHLPTPDGARHAELRLGYRSTAEVLDLAARLLPEAAPLVAPTESVRSGRRPPRVVSTTAAGLAAAVAREAVALMADDLGTVGVIVPESFPPEVEAALAELGAPYGNATRDGLDRPITVATATGCRGLEFDAVVVAEPALVVDDAPRGLRLLYVALTRPTQHLSIVHARPLPAALTRV